MHLFITELIGTFFLTLSIGVSVSLQSPYDAFTIAATLTAVIYMGGHVSKAHYNPAITISFWLRGWLTKKQILLYFAAEFIGGIAGAGVAVFLTGKPIAIAPGPETTVLQLMLSEYLFTFLLATVILNVASSKDHPDNGFYGIAIGLTVLGGILTVGPVSGAAFNPAVALAHNLVNGSLHHVPLYLLACFAGGAAAVPAFFLMNPGERRVE